MDRACAAESEYDRLQPEAMRRQATCWTAVPQAPLPERLPALRRARGGPGSPNSKRALSCTPQQRRGHDEEVDRDKIGDVIFEEGPPGLRGRFRTARHEPTNRAL